ncbi:sugar fermentation stimulation protein [Geothrix limicola]|uniref:Sugar fermentation stimulation protein homolog n=1 Tax=Geothrix limicola TaxID=2927978 RepID=A0ABQ5QCP8_9BACT|nr:DNA/RNA nuclease SfsA [Geothrix limicola]GLH72334.1 sugar fermentation stimulation protein [Geothrix limicola]
MILVEKTGLVAGSLIQRYKRFLADVQLPDGSVVTAHTTNTGSMKTCWEPGDRVLLEPASNPARKLKYTWLAVERPGGWVGVETGMPNRVVAEAARRDALPGLAGLHGVRTEVRYGAENSRIDVLALDGEGRQVFIEVKNATLKDGDWALFPDAVTERGTKHLRELQAMVREGHRAAIAFFVHRTDVDRFDAAREIDPSYAAELDRAAEAGVAVLPLAVHLVTRQEADGRWILGWGLRGLLPWSLRR